MIGVIGGTGFYDIGFFGEAEEISVETEFGTVDLIRGTYKGKELVFLPRHGKEHGILAYQVNHHANLLALQAMGVERVLATVAAGGISPQMNKGDLVLIDQFISFHTRHYTYGKYSVDMTEPYCNQLRDIILTKAESLGYPIHSEGTYISFDGPRYETKAEILAFKSLGADVVGMTNAPEAALARELGLCYSAIVIVTNKAAGLSEDVPDLQTHKNAVRDNANIMRTLISESILDIPDERTCMCRGCLERALSARSH